MNRASSATGWVRNPVMISPDLDPGLASSYELGWTWNPITGCLNHNNGLCKGGGFPCYAYKLAHGRLKQRYLEQRKIGNRIDGSEWSWTQEPTEEYLTAFNDPFYPRFWEERLEEPSGKWRTGLRRFTAYRPHRHKPRGVFVCDMADLFGIGIPQGWTDKVMRVINSCRNDRFYLLTKQPQNLIKFSPFPENCWVGVTATNETMFYEACIQLKRVEVKVKYISLEPLLRFDHLPEVLDKNNWIFQWLLEGGLSWLIIGACTGSAWDIGKVQRKYPELVHKPYGNKWTAQPRIEWVREIVQAADKAGIPVFLKDNLKPLIIKNKGSAEYAPLWANGGYGTLRQEFPRV